ncbi:GyrI-like domain-containing protein [Chitinophaga vietnamensis]|uniref:GyrI-like domain-containing protein n=1 Tax=Chitinophaga vietnamensis TaxID=2593957 RepID=UPI001F41E28B|nr:GyrI-like domain-containing protein [Chitinophaga vietnamensis]
MRTWIFVGWTLVLTFLADTYLKLKHMDKLDLTKLYKTYYSAGPKPELATHHRGIFLSITGQGDPNGPAFAEATEALFTIAYAIKFICKKVEKDFTVCKLEGFWWVDDQTTDPLQVPRHLWRYELVIRMPDYVTRQQFAEAVTTAEKKKNNVLLRKVDLKDIQEGQCVQILHTGPFSEEPATLALLFAYMKDAGLVSNGRHHEIYLSDFRKTAPEKLRTILRHPVKAG